MLLDIRMILKASCFIYHTLYIFHMHGSPLFVRIVIHSELLLNPSTLGSSSVSAVLTDSLSKTVMF